MCPGFSEDAGSGRDVEGWQQLVKAECGSLLHHLLQHFLDLYPCSKDQGRPSSAGHPRAVQR